MKSLARSHVWSPRMDADLGRKARQCDACQVTRNLPPEAPLHPWEWPHKPWVRLHLDFAGPFLEKMFLILLEAHSKWIEAFPTTSSTSSATIEKLSIAFATRIPGNGCDRQWQQFCQQRVRILHEDESKRDPEVWKPEYQVSSRYRITPQTSTGFSPAELSLGRKPRSRLDLVYPEMGRKVRVRQCVQKEKHDLHAKKRIV